MPKMRATGFLGAETARARSGLGAAAQRTSGHRIGARAEDRKDQHQSDGQGYQPTARDRGGRSDIRRRSFPRRAPRRPKNAPARCAPASCGHNGAAWTAPAQVQRHGSSYRPRAAGPRSARWQRRRLPSRPIAAPPCGLLQPQGRRTGLFRPPAPRAAAGCRGRWRERARARGPFELLGAQRRAQSGRDHDERPEEPDRAREHALVIDLKDRGRAHGSSVATAMREGKPPHSTGGTNRRDRGPQDPPDGETQRPVTAVHKLICAQGGSPYGQWSPCTQPTPRP